MAAEPGIPGELGPRAPCWRPQLPQPGHWAVCLQVLEPWGGAVGATAARTPRRHPLPGTCLTVGRGVEPTGSHLLPPSRPRLPVPGSGV